ncbi:MAG: transcriptional regulator with GAF, ATPase, and Fis domain, partial [Candidatus Omnitrophota bacterium]
LILFTVYDRAIPELDIHLEQQQKRGDSPIAAPFAAQVLKDLSTYGFSTLECLNYLAMFFQIRRAFYFVDRSLVGRSDCMRALRRRLWNNIFTSDIRWYVRHLWNRMEDYSLMLLGETGTGKGAAAQAIGRSGLIPYDDRKGCFVESFAQAFNSINLSEFTETLIESELFGHRKGAFTGAVDHYEGAFARCSPHGSIFLDELGDVAAPVQIKLLNVIQNRTFTPVGSRDRKRFQGRVIAATNKDLDQLRARGEFRDDLYYRLCSDCILVPPLRTRIQEDPRELKDMVSHLLIRLTGNKDREAFDLVMETLERDLPPEYAWPGNVRELEQAIRRVLITHEYTGDSKPTSDGGEGLGAALFNGTLTANELMAQYCKHLFKLHPNYSRVAEIVELDRRTVKKYIDAD